MTQSEARRIVDELARKQGRVNTVIIAGYGVQSTYMASVLLADGDADVSKTVVAKEEK